MRRKKMQARKKVERSRDTVFFPCLVAQEDRKVGPLKQAAGGAMWPDDSDITTPSWPEADLEIKKLKRIHVRSSVAGGDVEKVHASVVRSTFGGE